MQFKNFIKNHKKLILLSTFYFLYLSINFILLLFHEPWRDEIHAWLMSKELSIPQLFVESRFDGHPILWHLILMPFAKLNFPIITLNIISFAIVAISSWIFLFKCKLNFFIKIISLFTVPFTYIYSANARNYCLIIFLLVLISVLYKDRFKKTILYSFLVCLLIHTHSLAWGIVVGLTITFHFNEIFLAVKQKNTTNISKTVIGLILIILNTILVLFQLFGTSNSNYSSFISEYLLKQLYLYIGIILFIFAFTFLVLKSHYKEFIILSLGIGFQILIYTTFYSSILFERFMLLFTIVLFYLLLIYEDIKIRNKIHFVILLISYFALIFIFALPSFFRLVVRDIIYPYSSAKEMATYINTNIPYNTKIYIDSSVIGQSMIPYLPNHQFYDIGYEELVTHANVAYDQNLIIPKLQNINQYSGNYLIISNNIFLFEDYELLYNTSISIKNEYFSLYYIP